MFLRRQRASASVIQVLCSLSLFQFCVFMVLSFAFFWGGGGHPQVKKKQKKQGKISTFFVPKSAGKKVEATSDKPVSAVKAKGAAAGDDAPAALPGGRSGARVLGVRLGIADSKHDGEGRSITVEYEKVTGSPPSRGQKSLGCLRGGVGDKSARNCRLLYR